jgi:hypothetical protein
MRGQSVKQTLKIFVPERPFDGDWVNSCNLVLSMIEHQIGRGVQISGTAAGSDMAMLTVFDIREALQSPQKRRRWFGASSVASSEGVIRDALSLRGFEGPIFVRIAENLERPEWRKIGALVRDSDFARVSFWPQHIDAKGERLPYWWNYVRWPELSRPSADYRRYGRLYELDRLLAPIDGAVANARPERAVFIGSNMEFPRPNFLAAIEKHIPVDVFGGNALHGPPKIDFLRRYRYAICPENSLGFGYCTEKVPEAWDSGCIPLAVTPQPMTDWPDARFALAPSESNALEKPLLRQRPNLENVATYVTRFLSSSRLF